MPGPWKSHLGRISATKAAFVLYVHVAIGPPLRSTLESKASASMSSIISNVYNTKGQSLEGEVAKLVLLYSLSIVL